MSVDQYRYIEQWENENDLAALPNAEDDQHEYKRSATPDKELGEKISVAASAFWNTGGGIFVAGVDDTGKIDGGITGFVGRQSRRDWADQYIARTQPPGPYLVKWIDQGTSITANCGVLVVAFGEDAVAHMAYDNRYYVRLGAHSQSAGAYLVEAVRARKTLDIPIMRALLQRSRRSSDVVELAIVVVNDASALDVQINLEPLPEWLGYHRDSFPLQIPVIDRSHPFTMELYAWGMRQETFGENPVVRLIVDYKDTIGRRLPSYIQDIDVVHNLDPMTIGDTDRLAIMKAIQEITVEIKALHKTVASWNAPEA